MKRALFWLLLLILSGGVAAQQSEVRWKTVVEGFGEQTAQIGDTVAITYTLRLAGGDIIDQTPEGKTYPVTLGSNKVIPGMAQGLLGMKRGETRTIEVPPGLGYGSRQMGPIPPDSTLFFRIELKSFVESSPEEPDHEDHAHGDGDGDGHSAELHEKFGRDGFEHRPDAQNLDKPAMFEYLIRDFFTRPWRYDDAPRLVWRANGVLTTMAVLAGLLSLWLRRREESQR